MQNFIVNNLLFVLTVLGQVFIVLASVYLVFFHGKNKIIFEKFHSFLTRFIGNYALLLSFLVALIATMSSLYYSNVVGYLPCELCWFQRIFMYPQVVLLGFAALKKDLHIIDYSLALIGIGSLISIYHNYIYYNAQVTPFCSISSPCTASYVSGFGYISIPLMSLTAFIIIGLLLINKKINV